MAGAEQRNERKLKFVLDGVAPIKKSYVTERSAHASRTFYDATFLDGREDSAGQRSEENGQVCDN